MYVIIAIKLGLRIFLEVLGWVTECIIARKCVQIIERNINLQATKLFFAASATKDGCYHHP